VGRPRGARRTARPRVMSSGCPLCAHPAAAEIAASSEARLVRCGACTLAYADPPPRLDVIHAQYERLYGLEATVARREVPIRALTPGELHELSARLSLSLTTVEMGAVREHFRTLSREPTDLELEAGEIGMSVITYGELVYGALKHDQSERALSELNRLAELIPVLPLPTEAGDAYGTIRGKLAGSGQIIGPNDLWIAAHALVSDLTLVTNNEREFKRVKDLKIENWAK